MEKDDLNFTLYCSIEALLNLLMIFFISFYYYSDSAKRGFFSRMALAVGSIVYLIAELLLIFNFKIDEGEEDQMYVVDILRQILKLEQSTNQELRYLVQVWFCAFIASVYTFTAMFFPPDLEIMFEKFFDLTNCYIQISNKYKKFADKMNA